MDVLFYSAITSLIISFLIMPLFVKFLRRIQVMDKGGRRKIHKGTVPSMGGIIMFIAFLCAVLLWFPRGVTTGAGRYVASALALMALVGVRDDIVPVAAIFKLVIQCVAASLIVFYGNIYLHSLYGLFGVGELPLWLGKGLSILFIVFVTNAFNLIDGIDGLAGTVAFVVFAFLALWNFWVDNTFEAIYLSCFVGALVGFLYYNWQPASIFMGDTGSLVTGMLLSVSTLKFIAYNGSLPDYTPYKFHAVLSVGAVMVLVPVFDITRVFIIRLWKGRSPFSPDKRHIHHGLLRKGYSHAGATQIIVISYILVAVPILFMSSRGLLQDWALLLVMLVILVAIDRYLNYLLSHLHKEKDV